MRALDKLREIASALQNLGIDAPEKEAEILLLSGLDIGKTDLFRDNPEIPDAQVAAIESMVDRRVKREPLQYILGSVDFMNLKLMVGPGVLIPRPETELMSEYAIRIISAVRGPSLRILDLCTGSGCLALSIAREFPSAEVYGIDISEIALSYARKNAELNGILNVSFLMGDLFEPIASSLQYPRSFDLIISNPPYIRTGDMKDLQPEIREWEPSGALDGGRDGLDYYRKIVSSARQYLSSGGMLVLELGESLADAVVQLYISAGFDRVRTEKDYAGIERIVAGECS